MYFHHTYLRNKFIKTTTVGVLYFLGAFMYASFFTPYLQSIGWSSELIGIFFSLFAILGFFFAPLVGALSDSIGRFRMIMIGMGIEVVAIAGYFFFESVPVLLCLRVISAFSYNAVTVSALARVEDTVDNEKERSRISGFYTSAQALAVLAAPIIGGIVADYFGYKNLFLVSMLVMFGVLGAIIIYDKFKFSVDYPKRKRHKFVVKDFNPFVSINKMMKIPELRAIGVLGFLTNFSAPLRHLIIPLLVIEEFGLTNTKLSFLIFIIGFTHLFQFYFGHLADKYKPEKFIFLGNFFFVLCLIALLFVRSYAGLVVITIVYSIAGSFWNVSAWGYMSKIGEKHNIEGHVIGGYTALAHKSHTISFIVTGFLLTLGYAPVYIFYAGAIIIGLFASRKVFMNSVLKKSSR